ncbi:MAG: C25 family cysteine peptidase [Ignavibacteriaceae bacterium]
MKDIIVLILTFCLFSFNLFSQVSHTINFSFEKLIVSEISGLDKVTYSTVVYDDLQQTNELGSPELPVKYINLIIPSDQKVKDIVITLSNQKIFNITSPVYPVQPGIPTSIYPPKIEFVEPDSKIYDSDEPYPDKNAKIVHDGYFDGSNHIITVAVHPVQYKPLLNQLIFSSVISIRLETEASEVVKFNIHNRKESNQQIYNNILKKMVANTDDILTYQVQPSLSKESGIQNDQPPFYEYVIITADTLTSSFDRFIEWKERKGIDIGVVTVEEISSEYDGDYISGIYDEAGKLRQYLSDAYQEGTVWALLAGDYTVVPIRYGCGWNSDTWTRWSQDDYKIPTDLYFADFNGDWDVDGDVFYGQPSGNYPYDTPDYNPEIFVGRLLCTNSEEISNWTEKVINYEQNPGRGDTEYLTRAFMFESDDMQNGNEAEGVSNILTSFNTLIWRELPSYNSPNPSFPTGAEVIDEMNDTRYGLWSWFGHGEPVVVNTKTDSNNTAPRNQISPLDEMVTNITETGNGLDNLNNQDYPALVYTISCEITPFDDYNPHNWWNDTDKNLGEGFTVINNVGGPALLGNTRFGWVTYSSLLYRQFATLIEAGTTNLGVAELISKDNYSGGYDHYLSYSHNLIGCPETEIWVSTPSQFTSTSVTDGGSYLTVNAGVSGSTINVRSADNGTSYNLTANDVISYTFNTSVRPLFITISKNQYLPYTAITGGTLTTDATLWGKLNVLGTITVDSGKTLTIEPNTILRFASSTSLVVNGLLNSVGTSDEPITVTSQSGTTNSSWGTITLSGSGASGSTIKYADIKYGTRIQVTDASNVTIQYCNIDTCYDAVDFYNSTGSVLNNNITSNSVGHGIIIEQGSYAVCNYNTLTKTHTDRRGVGILFRGGATGSAAQNDIYHWDWGIGTIWSSYSISYPNNNGLNNRIRNCNSGLRVYRLSNAYYGYTAPNNFWGNSVYSNTYNASVGISYPEYESYLSASSDWWGSYPPNISLFQVGAAATFSYTPYLSSDPWAGLAKVATNSDETSTEENTLGKKADDSIEQLSYGIQLLTEGKYTEAKDYFLSLINDDPGNQVAYVLLYNCYNEETANDIIKFFENLPEKGSKDHKLLLSSLYLKEGDFKTAKEVNNSIIEENPGTDLATQTQLNNIYISLYNEHNINEAITSFNEVMKNTELSTPLELSLAHNAIENYGITYGKETDGLSVLPNYESSNEEMGKQDGTDESEIPGKYALDQNYPNPFNPSTTIKYQLPEDGLVTLKIYDVLGSEIATLVNEQKTAGKYEVNFDASSLSSGVYIYKIQAGNFISSKKMILLK